VSIQFTDERSLVAALSIEEKIHLLTGADGWTLHGSPAIGLRPMVLSDGPAGVRGTVLDASDPSSSLPCPVALGATWDEGLIAELAAALGTEARAKGVDVLLGPTINIVRTPLGGRGFECFSEDPVLTARIAVGYVRGLQRAGVGAAAKHYVANDSETERRTYDARITERVLRELYLAPFEACVTQADVAMVMAAYNSVNGALMTANAPLLRDVLKGEWGFEGVVVSDWSATRATRASALAGLDLVMPGPDGPWGNLLVAAVHAGDVPESEIDDKLARLLRLAKRVGALAATGEDDKQATKRLPRGAPSGTGSGTPVDPALLRRTAARSFVLLRNERAVLPLDPGALRSIAIIGPNAIHPQTQGGGSVRVLSVAGPTLVEAVRTAFDGAVHVHEGCRTWTTVPVPAPGSVRDPVSGESGVRFEVRGADGTTIYDERYPSSVVTWWDGLPKAVYSSGSDMVMRARYRAAVSGPHVIGAAGVGTVRIEADGVLLAQAATLHPGEVVEALSRPPEVRVPLDLRAGQEVEVRFGYRPASRGGTGFVTMRLGIAPAPAEDELIAEAVEAARACEVAVVVVGSADGTESEGYDRDTMELPGRQDELVSRVAAVNPNTIAVVNSGMPVLMKWVDEVAAVMHVWLPGQAMGEALADVVFGAAEPGGRLPVTIPQSETDSPVLHARPKGSELPYDEGLLVGYRGYDRSASAPLFCFGHGLGYTQWEYETARPATSSVRAGEDLVVEVTVRNGGARAGHEVVQAYLESPDDDPSRPLRALAAFTPVTAEPGRTVEARLTIPARAFARFDEAAHRWHWPPGGYTVCIGRSSRDLRLHVPLTLRQDGAAGAAR
jgi:beta-glucosidase